MTKLVSLISLISMLTLSACQVGRGGAISTPSAPAAAGPTTPLPTANPSSVPVPTITPTPRPSSIDGEFHQATKFLGQVFSDTGQPLEGVTITTKSLNPEVPYEDMTTTDASGAYLFRNGPKDLEVLLMASKEGYQTREQIIVIKTALREDLTTNRFDFGSADPLAPGSAPGLKAETGENK